MFTHRNRQNQFFNNHNLEKNLKSKSVRGATVTVTSQFVIYVLRFSSTAILARILTPQDYGIVAMTLVITGFANLFSDAGLSWATVQKDNIGHAQVSALFWINVTVGCLIAVTLAVIAPFVSALYGEPRIREVTCGLSVMFLLGGLTVQHQALLKRQMRFKALAIIDVLSLIVSISVGLIMAYFGFNYWSLVGMALSNSFSKLIAVWAAVPWKPGLPRRDSGVKLLLKFGGDVVWFNMVNYFSRHLDNFLIGRYWGAGSLGLYEKAYNLLLFPINQINTPLSSVVVPALSRINTDSTKFKRYFLSVFELITSVVTPVVLSIAIFADQIVELWLGTQWLECAALFRFLSVAALLGGLSNPIGWLLISAGRTQLYRNLGMISAVLIVAGFLLGLKFGAEGIAIGYSVSMVPATVIGWGYALRDTNIKPKEVIGIFIWPFGASITASAAALVILRFAQPLISTIFVLGLGLVVFFLVYIFLLLVVFRKWSFFLGILKAWDTREAPVL